MTIKQLLDTTKCKGYINNTVITHSQMRLKLIECARSHKTIQLIRPLSFKLQGSASTLARSQSGRQSVMENFKEHHIRI